MFKALKQSLKKKTPVNTTTANQEQTITGQSKHPQGKGQPQPMQSSLPDSYLDADSLFK